MHFRLFSSNKHCSVWISILQIRSIYIFGNEYDNSQILKWDITKSSTPSFNVLTNISMPPNISFASMASTSSVIDHQAYFIGLTKGENPTAKLYRFDIKTQSWDLNLSQMATATRNSCVTTNETHMFVVGGLAFTGSWYYWPTITQIYDIQHDTWSTYQWLNVSTLSGVSGAMCVMLHNTLYIFGGWIGSDWTSTGIWRNTWPQNEWIFVGDLAQETASSAIVNHCDNNVIISGGNSHTDPSGMSWIQVFDIQSDEGSVEYEPLGLIIPLYGFSGVIVDDKMYLFGGLVGDDAPVPWIQTCKLDDTVCGIDSASPSNAIYWILIVSGAFGIFLFIGVLFYKNKCKNNNYNQDEIVPINQVGEQVLGK